VIVIHPGSLYLRLGRGTDSSPCTVLHCIARKRKPGGVIHRDPALLPQAKLDSESWRSLDDARLQVFQALSKITKRDGTKRDPPTSSRVLELNNGISPEEVEKVEETTVPEFGEVVVGEDVAKIPASLPYNVHFPFRRGDLHLHPSVGGSLSSILLDLEAIWVNSIQHYLDIPHADLKHYRAVLVIPALYNRGVVKHLISLLLLNIGFGGCFVVQDHVAATFGAGLGAACVVDVGDQKTSISCVEDGVSLPSSRIQLGYGGADITQLLYFLSRQTGFPYPSCDPVASIEDSMVLHRVKEERCCLDLEQASLVRHIFIAKDKRYSLYLGDETRVAPLGLFHQDLLEVTGRRTASVLGPDPGDPEDPHDHLYLRETSRKYTKTGDLPQAGGEGEDFDEAVVDPEPQAQAQAEVLPLDQAILRSIDSCPGEEAKRKMLASVLVVGGGFRFPGAARYLQSRLCALLGPHNPAVCEVTMDPKDGDSDVTCWRGAAVLAGLESAMELWIRPREWSRHGQKLLRERAPFPWA